MKKTLAAVAILGAFAGSAFADVTVYGNMDTALVYQHTASEGDKVAMKSSGMQTSLVGFKGSEKISDNLTVGFKLEAAFDMDTGLNFNKEKNTTNALFARESLVYAKTAYGEFGFGRTGSLGASTGSYAFLGSGNTGWGGGVLGVLDNGFIFKGKASRLDNAVTYVSPKMAGVTLYAQVGSENDQNGGNEYTHLKNRYYAAGAKYAAGAFNAGLVVTQQDYAQAVHNAGADDALVVSGYANYDFGVAKVAFAAESWDNLGAKAGELGNEGYGMTLAVVAPVAGGKLTVGAGYGEQEPVAGGDKTKYKNVGTHFDYPLSKQTGLYAGLNYAAEEAVDDTKETTVALVGLYHKF